MNAVRGKCGNWVRWPPPESARIAGSSACALAVVLSTCVLGFLQPREFARTITDLLPNEQMLIGRDRWHSRVAVDSSQGGVYLMPKEPAVIPTLDETRRSVYTVPIAVASGHLGFTLHMVRWSELDIDCQVTEPLSFYILYGEQEAANLAAGKPFKFAFTSKTKDLVWMNTASKQATGTANIRVQRAAYDLESAKSVCWQPVCNYALRKGEFLVVESPPMETPSQKHQTQSATAHNDNGATTVCINFKPDTAKFWFVCASFLAVPAMVALWVFTMATIALVQQSGNKNSGSETDTEKGEDVRRALLCEQLKQAQHYFIDDECPATATAPSSHKYCGFSAATNRAV
eukprot:TRINITY_DN6081_c0_g1_i2.p1 TRINITY_DN6081_c0_g1~~TRINITY_DN6081_c0_g1_i2.p1  ORF type:complete len:345 (+),score=86.33 TRINITY_DN6081_c0_g1_i2:114-1148(+)